MKNAKLIAVSVCVLATAACVVVVRAAPGPDASNSQPKFSTLIVTPQRAQAHRVLQMKRTQIDLGTATSPTSAKTLSEADLHTLLDNMGLSPTTGTYSDGSKYENISESHGDWTFNFTLNFSPDTTNIWITIWLDKVKDPDNAKATNWYSLLNAEGSLWPAYFSYSIPDAEITGNLAVANSNVTPALMRNTLDKFMNNLSATSAAWSASNWTYGAAAAAVPSAPSTN